jgi:hypothetical protein
LFKKQAEKENGRKICADVPTERPTPAAVPDLAPARAASPPVASVRPRGPMDAFAKLFSEAEKKKRKLT